MKISEMNSNQRQMYVTIVDECNDFIGGWENTLEDSEEGSEDWLKAKEQLSAGHDTLTEWILSNVRYSRAWERNEYLHFVGLDWIKERISRRLKAMGY